MAKKSTWLLVEVMAIMLVICAFNFLMVQTSFASEDPSPSGDYEFDWRLLPFREVIVDGNADRFKAQHWVNDGYGGGLEEFYLFQRAQNDVTIKMEGQAIPNNNEYEGLVEIKKKELGYVKFDYKEFRRYYDRQGGVNYRLLGYRGETNALANQNLTPKELALDIGHFGVETGLRMEGYPEVTFGYEREFRDGAKSRLRWGSVVDAGNTNLTRKIAPAYSDIKEVVDKFDLKIDHTVKGFELKNDNKFEQVRIDQTTTELQFSPDTDPSRTNQYILKQHVKPESKEFQTAWQVAKWLFKDKIYSSTGYRFATIKAQEFEETNEYDEFLNPYSTGTNSENRAPSRADTYYETNVWVQHLLYRPFKWLDLDGKLKGELANRHGESDYNRVLNSSAQGAGSTDGQIDNTLVSETEVTQGKLGESFRIRFGAIPRTSIYSELELEQSDAPTSESRLQVNKQTVVSDSETYQRETITQVGRGAWTIGGRITPVSILDFTSHFRHLRKDTTYNDIKETTFTSTNAYSAFFAGQKTRVNEFLTRLGLKLTRFFQPSARFVHRETRYYTSVENTPFSDQPDVPTGVDTNNYIFDVTSQLMSNLMAMASFSRLGATTWTPAKDAYLGPTQIGNIPAFESNVNTWTFSLAYSPKKNFSFINSLHYARANNFDDFSDRGLPLGADYRILDVESGLKLTLLKDRVAFEPKYGLYHYNANANVDAGDYTAHVLSCELTMAWG